MSGLSLAKVRSVYVRLPQKPSQGFSLFVPEQLYSGFHGWVGLKVKRIPGCIGLDIRDDAGLFPVGLRERGVECCRRQPEDRTIFKIIATQHFHIAEARL